MSNSVKIGKAFRSGSVGPSTFDALIKLLPDSVITKLNSKEIADVITLLYNQKVYGEDELYAEFADVIKVGLEANKKIKNTKDWQLKKCIFLSDNEFETIMQKSFGDDVRVEFSSDGIWVDSDSRDTIISTDEINDRLSNYYGVTVTSVHIDDYDEVGVWVCYK